ncbi:MAG TPA: PQQ-binding-like beta-propeller repeat protein [Lacipirellulaceae bacterium]|nr:PQQ-binding-like beta-propeller repeat protein [Lacipirellulaceae bacterium]
MRPKYRLMLWMTLALALADAWRTAPADAAGRMLISADEAARVGMERMWFAQAPVDPSRSRASSWYLNGDQLFCVTDSGLITALNAETGAEMWTAQVGQPGVPAFGPEANDLYVGVVSGSRVYLLERATGRLKWSRELGSAPGSGPALSADYLYVALVTGRVEGYEIADPAAQPWYYQSKGRTFLRPTTTGNVVSWPTTEGYVYVSAADDSRVRFRLETAGDIVTSPAEQAPYLYLASLDGYLYCMHERTGSEKWRYSTGDPIMSSPAIVEDRVYVASIEPALHCLDAATGSRLWSIRGASHFGAKGKQRVYASDRYGNLMVLDADSGALVGRLRTAEGLETLVNDQSDRVFLVNDRGLVQCLREIGAEQPTYFRHSEEPAALRSRGASETPEATAEPAVDVAAPEQPAEQPAAFPEGAETDPLDDGADDLFDDNPFE